MPGKDYPDWGGYPVSQAVYPLKDLGEAVVRLGSPVIWDRGGAVALIEDFEQGLGRVVVQHTGSAVNGVLVGEPFRSGGFSCQMDAKGTAADYSQVIMEVPPLPTSKLGLSVMFSIDVLIGYLELHLDVYQVGAWRSYKVRYDALNARVQVYDNSDGWVTLGSFGVPNVNAKLFHHFKLVIDTATELYHRVLLNDQLYTQIASVPKKNTGGTYSTVKATIRMTSGGAMQNPIYVDNLILTYLES